MNGRAVLDKDLIIQKLGLVRLPEEGGFYRETYRSDTQFDASRLSLNVQGTRSLGTAIMYMVTAREFSAIHRLKADEIFHFYGGDPVEMYQFEEGKGVRRLVLGSDLLSDQQVQTIVPAGTWQGTRLVGGGSWALMGTTVSPGFDFADFELGSRDLLIGLFPYQAEVIHQLTRVR